MKFRQRLDALAQIASDLIIFANNPNTDNIIHPSQTNLTSRTVDFTPDAVQSFQTNTNQSPSWQFRCFHYVQSGLQTAQPEFTVFLHRLGKTISLALAKSVARAVNVP